jgi:hypothetical protein
MDTQPSHFRRAEQGKATATPDPNLLPTGFAALRDAILDLERFRGKVRELTGSRQQAQDDDRKATARAIWDSKPDHGPRMTQDLDLRPARERNGAEGCALLVQEAEAHVMAGLAAHAAEYDGLVDRMADEARAALASSLVPVRPPWTS